MRFLAFELCDGPGFFALSQDGLTALYAILAEDDQLRKVVLTYPSPISCAAVLSAQKGPLILAAAPQAQPVRGLL